MIDKAVQRIQHSANFTAQSMKMNYYYKPSLNFIKVQQSLSLTENERQSSDETRRHDETRT